MTMIGSPACPLGRLEGQARGGGEGEGRYRLSSPPPKGATPCDRPPRGAILIPRPLGVVDYSRRFTATMKIAPRFLAFGPIAWSYAVRSRAGFSSPRHASSHRALKPL